LSGSQNNIWQNTVNDPNFTWNPGVDTLSGLKGYYYYWGGDAAGTSSNFTASNGYNASAVDTGVNYLRIKTEDNIGNAGQWITGYTFKYDNIKPEASASSPADTSNSVKFTVSWGDGTDKGGAGLSGTYDVKFKDGTGEWQDWQLTDSACVSAVFKGEPHHTYYFEAAARDNAGNVEDFEGTAECAVYVFPKVSAFANPISGEQSGSVEIRFLITNPDSNSTDIQCEYSLGDNDNYSLAAVTGKTENLMPHEYEGSITWDSNSDLPGLDLFDVRFKVIPVNNENDDEGMSYPTNSFHLDNNSPISENCWQAGISLS